MPYAKIILRVVGILRRIDSSTLMREAAGFFKTLFPGYLSSKLHGITSQKNIALKFYLLVYS